MRTHRILVSLVVAGALLANSLQAADAADPLAVARAALAQNDLGAAETALLPLTQGESPNAVACFELARLRMRANHPTEAIALLETATKMDATKAEYFSLLGSAIGQQMGQASAMQRAMLAGKLRKAFAKSVELDANHLPGLIGLARFYMNAPEIAGGSAAKAAEFAERVKRLNPALGEQELATIAEHEDQLPEALTHLEAAAKLMPNNPSVQVGIGRVQATLGKKDEARAAYTLALKLDPNLKAAQQGLAALEEK